MNFYINHIKINTITNLGSINIGYNILSDNKATEITEGVNNKEPDVVSEEGLVALPPPLL